MRVLTLVLMALTALLTTACSGRATWPETDRPNILLLVADDLRWDQLGVVQNELGDAAQFPFLQTPHLDALAGQGVRFRNAFVTTSLCSPSRASILTGQYVHQHLVIDNRTHFPDRPSFATALRDAGYATAYFGKWHQGVQRERPGFDYVATFMGQGEYHDTPFIVTNRWLDKLGFGPRWTTTEGYVDERTVDFMVDYLDTPRDKPFAIMLAFKGVHQPFTPMEQHRGRYAGREVVPPANWSALPPWVQARDVGSEPPRNADVLPAMLETVLSVDASVGRVMRALEERGLADNTLVLFTSDNGYYLGEHMLGDKRSAYEPSMRVPLLARFPGVVPAGSVADDLVLNIDIAPTLVDAARADVPGFMQGRSLLPLFTGGAQSWRDDFLYEFWYLPYDKRKWRDGDPGHAGVIATHDTPTIAAVRTRTHKLITYRGRPEFTELYDLVADPLEVDNLADSTAHTELRAAMCTRLRRLAADTGYDYLAPVEDWWRRSRSDSKDGSIYAALLAAPDAVSRSDIDC